MKTCCRCKLEKPLSDFYRDARNADGARSECRACSAAGKKATYDPAKQRAYRLNLIYGISVEEFTEQARRQNNKCAVCLTDLFVGVENHLDSSAPVVDHDHDHDSLRGILCQDCNRNLGKAGDSLDGFDGTFGDYLRNPPWQITGQMELPLEF